MVDRAVRTTDESVELYAGGKRVMSVSPLLTKVEGSTVQLSTSDVGRVFAGSFQMNPMTQYVPSTLVTPHMVWLPYVGQVNILLNILWAAKTFLDALQEESEPNEPGQAQRRRIERFQLVDFNSFLPENT